MIKKLTNKQLLLILVVLIGIYAIGTYIKNKRGENTFHTNIIPKIDTNAVNGFYIYPKIQKTKPIRFDLKGKTWMVSSGGVTSRAEKKSESYIINLIKGITPDHLATNDPAHWKDYDVTDSSGTRVVLLHDKDTLIDILVGRFSYNNQLRKAMSCVRLHGQNEVYYVDGFLTMNVANDFTSWRDRQLLDGDETMWNKLTYIYPADSGFIVSKDAQGNWIVNNEKPDSIGIHDLLKKLAQQNYGGFVDKFDTNASQAVFQLQVMSDKLSPFVVKAYAADSTNGYVITSSLNPGAYMSGKNNGLFNNIFLSKSAFFHHTDKPKPQMPPAKMPPGMKIGKK